VGCLKHRLRNPRTSTGALKTPSISVPVSSAPSTVCFSSGTGSSILLFPLTTHRSNYHSSPCLHPLIFLTMSTMTMTYSSTFTDVPLSDDRLSSASTSKTRGRPRRGSFKVVTSPSTTYTANFYMTPGLISPPCAQSPAYQSSPPYTVTPKTGEITIEFGSDPYAKEDDDELKFTFDPFTDDNLSGATPLSGSGFTPVPRYPLPSSEPVFRRAALSGGVPLSVTSSGKPDLASWFKRDVPERRGRTLTPMPGREITGYIPIELYIPTLQNQAQYNYYHQYDRDANARVLAGVLLNRSGKKGKRRSRSSSRRGPNGKREYVRSGLSEVITLELE
jgi:hypothetical protein